MMSWKSVAGEARGSEIAEAALVFPLVFMMLLGIYWFGRAFNIYATINHAAREGARAAVAQSCATCATPNSSLTTDQIADQVKQALQASHLDPNQVAATAVSHPGCNGTPVSCSLPSGAPQICVYRNVQLNTPPAGGGPPACGVSVEFQYPYQFFLPFTSLNKQLINLSANVQMKGEY